MSKYLLGLDCGHTVTKAVLFDLEGKEIQSGKGLNETISLHAGWQERTMEAAGKAATDAIKEAIKNIKSSEIIGIGICGHSDGLYLLDKYGVPLRNAIFATDNRAKSIAKNLAKDVGNQLLNIMGQFLFPASPVALLIWLKENEPENYKKIGSVLHCKDWIRTYLTGNIGVDVSDSSGSFVDMRTYKISDEILELTNLQDLRSALNEPSFSTEIIGGISDEIAELTGLQSGTPVIAGAHDVHAAAVGVGAYGFGETSLIFGTWSINQVFAVKPIPDYRWHTRASIEPNRWLHMSTSPASASNANWFWDLFGVSEIDKLTKLLSEADAALLNADRPIYLPYLYGGPAGSSEGASLIGTRGWHTKADIAASVIEGVVFNHKHHFDILSEKLDTSERLVATGGSMKSDVWAQLAADVFNLEIQIPDTQESGARGSAMLAGVATGIYSSISDAINKCVGIEKTIKPNKSRAEFLKNRYIQYRNEAKRVINV